MDDLSVRMRRLGARDVHLSELGFGAGGFWGMEVFNEDLAKNLVDIAIDRGINFFDTGPNYSGANAEQRLGKILAGRASKVLVGTKCGTHYIGGKHVKDYSTPALKRSLETSLTRLQRDSVDLLQLHDMPPELTEEIMNFLVRARERGDTRLLGVSTNIQGAEIALASGIFDCVMIEYNVIQRKAPENLIRRCADAGVGVLIKSPLAQTMYSNEIFKLRKLADIWYFLRALKNHRGKFLEGRKYRFLAEAPDRTPHNIALQYVLDNPGVSSAIIGTTREAHLLENIAASLIPIPPAMKRRIEAVV